MSEWHHQTTDLRERGGVEGIQRRERALQGDIRAAQNLCRHKSGHTKGKIEVRTLDPSAATNPSRLSDALAALNLALAMAFLKSSSLSPLADAFSA